MLNGHNLLPVPVPQKFEIELGHQILTVPDLSKPVWHGTYFAGKLSVYLAEVTGGEVIPDSVTYITTYTEHGGPEFMCYTSYIADMSVESIVTHLQEIVFNNYKLSIEDDPETYLVASFPGNDTKH